VRHDGIWWQLRVFESDPSLGTLSVLLAAEGTHGAAGGGGGCGGGGGDASHGIEWDLGMMDLGMMDLGMMDLGMLDLGMMDPGMRDITCTMSSISFS
jgi:hypothetical protein